MVKLSRLFLCLAAAGCASPGPSALPGLYFRMMESELPAFESELQAAPPDPEAEPDTSRLSAALFAEAVLYAKQHPDNPSYHDPRRLARALEFGDLLAAKASQGFFTKPLNHRWDLHFWLDAYRLVSGELGDERRDKWRRELGKLVPPVARDAAERADFPRFQSPFIRTSTNHFSLWGSALYLAGQTLGNKEWETLGAEIMHRLAAEEQTADGFWGEHSDAGPETGYNYLSLTGVALYWELSRDPAALEALRRATEFHAHFTYPDGAPVEVVNGRNRTWGVSPWGHFGFSNFPQGRRYAEFLTGFLRRSKLGAQGLGRIAQNALYFHEGPAAPIPQDLPSWAFRLHAPAGIRKSGPWTICLSGLIETQAVLNQFYLDRQAHLAIYHETEGLIVTGANSKRQPELATFWGRARGETFHLPMTSRLRMGAAFRESAWPGAISRVDPNAGSDRLSLSYPAFWADLFVDPPFDGALAFRFRVTEMGRAEEGRLTLQLRLTPGETLRTAKTEVRLGQESIELTDLGGWVQHRGWTIRADPEARLAWPVYPFNPYANGPETDLARAVAMLSVPLRFKPGGEGRLRTRDISFRLEVVRR